MCVFSHPWCLASCFVCCDLIIIALVLCLVFVMRVLLPVHSHFSACVSHDNLLSLSAILLYESLHILASFIMLSMLLLLHALQLLTE